MWNFRINKIFYQNLREVNVQIEYFGYEVSGFTYSVSRWAEIINEDADLKKSFVIENFTIVDLDCYDLPYPDNFFDIVLSNQVLEHVADFDSFYSVLDRVLKPSGIQIHCFPTKEILIEPHLRIPIVQKLLKKKYLPHYLKFMYFLKGETREEYVRERINYMKIDTNYRNRTYHLKKFQNMGYTILPSYNLFFLICWLQKIGLKYRFRGFGKNI